MFVLVRPCHVERSKTSLDSAVAANKKNDSDFLLPRLRHQNDRFMNPPIENVLVIRRSLFDQLGAFQGLNFEPEKYLKAFFSRGNTSFLPRDQAENDPTQKQIIPYVILAFEGKILYYVRGK